MSQRALLDDIRYNDDSIFTDFPDPDESDTMCRVLRLLRMLYIYDKMTSPYIINGKYTSGYVEFQLFKTLKIKLNQELARMKYIKPLIEKDYVQELIGFNPKKYRMYCITKAGKEYYEKTGEQKLLNYYRGCQGMINPL